jgi:hypothetical protein
VAALKDIRHSAQLPETRRTLRVQASPRKRTKVIETRSPASPGNFGRLSADLSELSGEGEFLPPATGRWPLAVTHLTGSRDCVITNMLVIARRPAIH